MESVDARKNALERWCSAIGWLQNVSILPMPNDASFRRYFRVCSSKGSFVAMDAPPPQENCYPFAAIARALHAKGLNTPEIFAEDLEQGFLLITDFGDKTYLKALNMENADTLYSRALESLTIMQGCREVPGRMIPPFTREFMLQEWAWHKEWFLDKWLGVPLTNIERALDDCYMRIIDMAATQPQVFMHRDYHSANLMVLPGSVGILDFQDAFIGPVTYDLVSLLRDCYISWPDERVTHWVNTYWRSLIQLGVLNAVTQQEFLHWFDWMGLQRHLKALLTFARKKIRDQQPQYLKHVPRTLYYLLNVSGRYPELNAMSEYLHLTVKPAVEREMMLCAL